MNLNKLKGKLRERGKTYADCSQAIGIFAPSRPSPERPLYQGMQRLFSNIR